MLQTVEAIIDANGHVSLLENVKIDRKRRALVTILDEEANQVVEKTIVGSIEILDDDLDGASRKIAEMFDSSIKKSAENLQN